MKAKMQKNKLMKQAKGITLIALVITIIILLILAGISIAMLTGDNGLLTKANLAKNETEKANVIEQAQLDILEKEIESKGRNITKTDLIRILEKYFDEVPEELPDDLTDFELTSKDEYGGQAIKIADIWQGTFEKEKEYIETATPFVGYYADIDGVNGVDGFIYADLAIDGSGRWNNDDWSDYAYNPVTTGLKSYYIKEAEYDGPFGKAPVLASEGNGVDRFYVMALEDITPGTSYYWYYAADGKLDKIVDTSYNDFGSGKVNTAYVMDKWDNIS